MVKYIVKRVLYPALILVIVSMLLYLLIRLLPMDYVENKFISQSIQGTISEEELYRIRALYGLEDAPDTPLADLLRKDVVICQEVGAGLVPVDAGERARREAVGRLCIALAREADRVVRVVCGVGMVIKG